MKIVLDDAHGNRVEIEGDFEGGPAYAADLARELYDHIRTEPHAGPASGGQSIGFAAGPDSYADMRIAEQPLVK